MDGNDWRSLHEFSQAKRALNRSGSAKLLKDEGIEFTESNGGAHLIITSPIGVDFWPGTGLWITKKKKTRGRGVRNLIKLLKGNDNGKRV